ncbi:hypothetical protein HPULCUR_002850 [Helicostylum pulchrum]|uniref:Uncharacterized protein n=1 Tax=Helicostylum pulchrum TaxID=562976 RepID=A0ABP9XRP2_9FUNG
MPKTTADKAFSTYTTMMRDLYDIFSAVLLQVTLTDHRVMFRSYPYTFTTDEAAKVMSSLVFIHIHRHPDPLEPSRQIATRTTTTFSMDYETAKNLIQHFLFARLITSATDPQNLIVRDRGVWCPTLKGKYVLEEFTDYTQVEMTENLIAALNAPYMQPTLSGSTGSRLIHLDRLTDNDDQITFSRPNMTSAFKAMMLSLPQDALLVDEINGIDKKDILTFQHTFVGLHCIDWLWDRLAVTSKDEAKMVAEEFILFGWIALVLDKSDKELSTNDDAMTFKTSKKAIYYVTDRGCSIIGWKNLKQKAHAAVAENIDIAVAEESDSDSFKKISMRKVVINTGKSNKMTLENAKYDFYLSNPESVSSAEMSQQDSSDIVFAEEQQQQQQQQQQQPESFVENKTLVPLRPSSMALTDSSASHASTSSTSCPDNSQYTRLNQILENPLLRLYFRDFLRSNYCVENINFWVDYHQLLKNIGKKTVLDQISECYSIYETYLGPAADVNIDYTLCQEIIKYVSGVFIIVSQLPPKEIPYFMLSPNMPSKNHNKPAKSSARLLLMPPQTNSAKQRIVTVRGTTIDKCLSRLLHMFARVNEHLFGMMAEDSLPKFVKTTVYKDLMMRQQQQLQELQDVVGEDGYDEDDEDSDQDEIVHVITALSDQRISLENNRNYLL